MVFSGFMWIASTSAPTDDSQFKQFKASLSNATLVSRKPDPVKGEVVKLDGNLYLLEDEIPIDWAVVKTESSTGDPISIVQTHRDKAICQNFADNCNKFADIGVTYVLKPL